VYLADLPSDFPGLQIALLWCKWFTRGWTLQELITPAEICFYDSAWVLRGTKKDWLEPLTLITGVRVTVLKGVDEAYDIPTAEKMSWASGRATIRVEDVAYYLVGICDVHMPMRYSEGTNAFRRLQEEVMRKTNDLSLLAWVSTTQPPEERRGAWAKSPSEFAWIASEKLQLTVTGQYSMDLELTSKGLRLYTRLLESYPGYVSPTGWWQAGRSTRHTDILDLDCHFTNRSRGHFMAKQNLSIRLRKFGPNLYIRDVDGPINTQLVLYPELIQAENLRELTVEHKPHTIWLQTEDKAFPFWIARRPSILPQRKFFREFGNYVEWSNSSWRDIHFPWHLSFVRGPRPVHGELWNCSDRTVMKGWQTSRQWDAISIIVTGYIAQTYEVLVICCSLSAYPFVFLIESEDELGKETLATARHRLGPDDEESERLWHRLVKKHTEMDREGSNLEFTTKDGLWKIQARRSNGIVPEISQTREVSSIAFDFVRL